MIKFLDILGRYEAAEFSKLDAAELLSVGERTFRRWRQRYEDDGEAGLLDRRLGKASGKRVPRDREAEVAALYKTRYPASRRSTFTSIWCAITPSPGAIRGPRRSCIRRGCSRAPSGAARIAASGRDGRCPG